MLLKIEVTHANLKQECVNYLFTEGDEPLTKDKFTKVAHRLVEAMARGLHKDKVISR